VREILDRLADAGVEVAEGPVPRLASNGVLGTSVYVYDPTGTWSSCSRPTRPTDRAPTSPYHDLHCRSPPLTPAMSGGY